MEAHYEIVFVNVEPEQKDILIASLHDAGYDGFEEKDRDLHAFVRSSVFDVSILNHLAYKYQVKFEKRKLEAQNWNSAWESSYAPVIVEDFCAIRASFHKPIIGVKHELIITPKMSFGTGHHATTRLMIRQMKEIDFIGKEVFDFGTGTGILAILAEKMGARRIIAIDNDEWSCENAGENADLNDCKKLSILKQNLVPDDSFDVVLANINRNTILENRIPLINALAHNGTMVLCGFTMDDEDEIRNGFASENFRLVSVVRDSNWSSMRFSRVIPHVA